MLTYNSQQAEAEQVVKEIEALGSKAVTLQLNVAETESFDGFIEKVQNALTLIWQRADLDILINNAGIGIHKPFTETTEADFDMLVDIQFKGPFFLTQKMLPLLKDGGSIINISSGLARFSTPGYSAYAAMKGAMETLTRYQAKELGARGIRVNIVAPGAIETDFGGGVVRDNQQLNTFIASQTALGRVGLPDDIGGLIASLCMPEMSWVTAQRIEASGGMFL
ncbi:SDR family NAD(P)-dependent oxidoreductase [Niabella hibiscisoli]|uniref:SDR family NAD(P)-dependent oxidoreductase n=1 Tax=Niabella hibiscisoli TaxID=1825928 RepID=UPI00293EE14F|nr:SDR family oxidoreductase [Niabella hibiscisoli]